MRVRAFASLALAWLLVPAVCAAGSLHGSVKGVGGRSAAEAVVYLGAIPGASFPPPAGHVRIDQEDMMFAPHVSVVLVGTTVDFLNSDPVLHNVFSPDKCAEKFNLGSWPQGQTRSYTFKQPCVATLLCNVHPEMEAFVVAVPTPYFSIVDAAGAYVIADVPDGTYKVSVWHPKFKELTKEVTVSAATALDFELKK